MPLTLRPYPGLYAELDAEWDIEDIQRQYVSKSGVRKYIISQRNHFLALFVILILAMLLLQLSLFLYKMYTSRRRNIRRHLYANDAVECDVEDVVAISWVEDEKAMIMLDGGANE